MAPIPVTVGVVTVLNIVGIVSVVRANSLDHHAAAVFIGSSSAWRYSRSPVTEARTCWPRSAVTAAWPGRARSWPARRSCACPSSVRRDLHPVRKAREPTRSVPKAINDRHGPVRVLYFALSYVSQLVFPSNSFTGYRIGSLDVMVAAVGRFLNAFFTAVYVAAAVGCAVTSQASVARILYAMGRDGIPASAGVRTHLRAFGTPAFATLVVS